jgi:hypothetical protein
MNQPLLHIPAGFRIFSKLLFISKFRITWTVPCSRFGAPSLIALFCHGVPSSFQILHNVLYSRCILAMDFFLLPSAFTATFSWIERFSHSFSKSRITRSVDPRRWRSFGLFFAHVQSLTLIEVLQQIKSMRKCPNPEHKGCM